VVPTLDIVAEQGEVFLVMEYVQGESLASIARMMREKGGLPRPEIAATILAGVLHGLQAAHEAKGERGESLGIVHRDVSPQNILVGLDGVPRVVDFGVAKAVDRIGDTTGDGQLKGKLAYMPPEQVGGAVGPTTDVYAASVVLWETLTGRRLFGGGNQLEVYDKIMKGTVEPPSKHVPGLSPALDAVTMRGLSREPRDRYQTAREMALALEEASPMATASKIGAWVEAEAGATLRERARRVAEIESDSAMVPPSRQSLPSSPSLSDFVPPPRSSGNSSTRALLDAVPHTQLSSGSATDPAFGSLPRPRSRRSLLAASAAGAALLLVLGLAFRQSQSSAVPASSPPVAESLAPIPGAPSSAPVRPATPAAVDSSPPQPEHAAPSEATKPGPAQPGATRPGASAAIPALQRPHSAASTPVKPAASVAPARPIDDYDHM